MQKDNYNIIWTTGVSFPDELDKSRDRPWYQRWVRTAIAGLFVLATFYLFGGVYELTRFMKTPGEAPAGSYEPQIAAATTTIPTTVFFLQSSDASAATSSLDNLIDRTNRVLSQIRVSLLVDTVTQLPYPADYTGSELVADPEALERLLPPLDDKRLHIVVTETLGGINGVAFSGSRTVAVAEYTTSFDFRVLAHEVGHVLGLNHVNDRANLMYSGGSGVEVTQKQAESAHAAAERFTGDES